VSIEPAVHPTVPRFRGRLHQAAFFAALPAGVALVLAAPTAASRAAAIVYAISLAALYGTSAAYHRLPWSHGGRRWMKRLDHSMIFLLIAGTYTPFALLVLRGPWRISILAAVWGLAAVGVILKMVHIDGLHALGGVLYICLGWVAIVAAPQILRGLSGLGVGLLLAGGVFYTTGAVVLNRHRPDPDPAVFGYHEVWHSFVVGASMCHYVLILLLLLSLH
jgi:hemolysin III